MKKMILRAAVAAAGLALIFSGCATDKSVNKDAYYNENIKDFSRTNLKNGIPVIFKKTGSSQIFVMRVIFEGGTPLVEKKLAGIEKLTMDLMFHGSAGYSYEDIQKMQYTTTFSMTNSSGRDYSVAGIKCLEKVVVYCITSTLRIVPRTRCCTSCRCAVVCSLIRTARTSSTRRGRGITGRSYTITL